VFRGIGRLAQSHVTVLITGESGSGKELVAHALHKHSPRAHQPFVAINTAAIPKDLLESELFGHERGAFTGAQASRRGRFEQADGGTLFLDEIGDMPFDLQTRLLRVLSDGHFYRVGGHSAVKANVRVIAATHQNLEQRVKEGVFREDLYHRLNVIRLRLPALRERREDVPVLARYFLQRSAQQLGVEPKRIADAALECLSHFQFPGNVRQLENICHWLTVMAPAQVIEVKDLPPEVLAPQVGAVGAAVPFAAMSSGLGGAMVATVDAVDAGNGTEDGRARALTDLSGEAASLAVNGGLDVNGLPVAVGSVSGSVTGWESGLEQEALALLNAGHTDVWDVLTRRFETSLIQSALATTRGRRIEAAQKLGIGRNTITRKIQELGIDEA
jgi:two-component system nitrogen regulation response regulator GlnG